MSCDYRVPLQASAEGFALISQSKTPVRNSHLHPSLSPSPELLPVLTVNVFCKLENPLYLRRSGSLRHDLSFTLYFLTPCDILLTNDGCGYALDVWRRRIIVMEGIGNKLVAPGSLCPVRNSPDNLQLIRVFFLSVVYSFLPSISYHQGRKNLCPIATMELHNTAVQSGQ
jgi:hypothetical protein